MGAELLFWCETYVKIDFADGAQFYEHTNTLGYTL
jgi:hypothetical protein